MISTELYTISLTLEGALSSAHRVTIQTESEQSAIDWLLSHPTPFLKTDNGDYVNLNKLLWFSVKKLA